MIIKNGANTLLNQNSGTLPDVSGALLNLFQKMTFEKIIKSVKGFQAVEDGTNYAFQGVWQPFTEKQLLLKPEGQRAWSWFWLHSDTSLTLDVDEIVVYCGIQYRVMALKDYSLYGYLEYQLVNDWTGSSPQVVIS